MYKEGLKKRLFQRYKCGDGHVFKLRNSNTLFDDSFIEYAVAVYLRSLSLNATIGILRMYYEQDLLTKPTLLDFIEIVSDKLPSLDEIDYLYNPQRSGYIAFDGVWYKWKGLNFVLLVSFDPLTLDVVSYIVSEKESYESYRKLIEKVIPKFKETLVKGLYCDGDRGLIKALNGYFPSIPIQVCVVHKEFRLGQILPFKRAYAGKTIDPGFRRKVVIFKETTEAIIYADTKLKSEENFLKLNNFMKKVKDEKLKKAFGSLRYNFKYILTHFDHPEMERDNNIIEGFNSIIKRRLKLLKGFKKPANIGRYIKLVLLDYRFHELVESRFPERRKSTPLNLAKVDLPSYYNFIKLLRQTFNLSFSSS